MSITRKITSAVAVVAATTGLLLAPGAGTVAATDSAISGSAAGAMPSIGLPNIRIECVRIFVDFDTDETRWICRIVWN